MSLVIIVGAGRVGTACASLLFAYTNNDIVIIDNNQSSLDNSKNTLYKMGISANYKLAENDLERKNCIIKTYQDWKSLLSTNNNCIVLACTPFKENIKIARICYEESFHYVDLTEDIKVTASIIDSMNPLKNTFVLQTGLAPGLITSIGFHLCSLLLEDKFIPHTLKLRVGALPQVAIAPEKYNLTWSTAGLMNEYIEPVQKIEDYKVCTVESMIEHEKLIIEGVQLEAFNTSGGLGDTTMYTSRSLKNVDYKSIRYPGHLKFLNKKLIPAFATIAHISKSQKLDFAIMRAEDLFTYTRDDQVFLMAMATGERTIDGKEMTRTYSKCYKARDEFTALELYTAGTAVSVITLIDNSEIGPGIILGGEIPLNKILGTEVGKYMNA